MMIRRRQRTLFALIFSQSLNRVQRGLSAIAELLVVLINCFAFHTVITSCTPLCLYACATLLPLDFMDCMLFFTAVLLFLCLFLNDQHFRR